MQLSSMKNKTSFVTPANVVLSIVKRAQSSSGFTLIYQAGLNSSRSVIRKKYYCKLCRAVFVSTKEQKKPTMKNKQGQGKKKRSKNDSANESGK